MAKEIILPFSELRGTLDAISNEPTLEITENGVYNVKGYTYADVNVEGGGSSDFSVAKLTVAMTENTTQYFSALNVITVGENSGQISEISISSPQTIDIVLYKGFYVCYTDTTTFVSVSGNATYEVDGEDVTINITGDCTITLNQPKFG